MRVQRQTRRDEKGLPFIVENVPTLISKDVTCNIFGAKTENRFASCQRDVKNGKSVCILPTGGMSKLGKSHTQQIIVKK